METQWLELSERKSLSFEEVENAMFETHPPNPQGIGDISNEGTPSTFQRSSLRAKLVQNIVSGTFSMLSGSFLNLMMHETNSSLVMHYWARAH